MILALRGAVVLLLLLKGEVLLLLLSLAKAGKPLLGRRAGTSLVGRNLMTRMDSVKRNENFVYTAKDKNGLKLGFTRF